MMSKSLLVSTCPDTAAPDTEAGGLQAKVSLSYRVSSGTGWELNNILTQVLEIKRKE